MIQMRWFLSIKQPNFD